MNRRALFVSGASVSALALISGVSAQESSDESKHAAIRTFFESQSTGDFSGLPTIVSPDFTSTDPENAPGVDALIQRLEVSYENRTSQSGDGFKIEVISTAVDGRFGACRLQVTAGNDGKVASAPYSGWIEFDENGLILASIAVFPASYLNEVLFGI